MSRPGWRIGPPRRATRNLLLPVDWRGRPLLIKYTRDLVEARQEIRGHAELAGHYGTPGLSARLRAPGGYLLAYERLPGGRDRGLLLDLLNADVPSDELITYMGDLTAAYREAITATAQKVDPTQVVRKLYWDRAASGGRLDAYYGDSDFLIADGIVDLAISRLAEYVLVVNGAPRLLGWTATLNWLREYFSRTKPVWAAVTQGDPTDVNLAHPLAWLDYDTAGTNAILGEFANFLWYTTALGGWLVPTYNPAAFTEHPATFAHIDANRPRLLQARVNHTARTLHVDYRHHLSAPRQAAASAYWHQLVRPIADKLWPGENLADLMRPYLVMRILGVYNLADLSPTDRLLVLVRLAEAMSPTFNPVTYFAMEETPCPAR